MIKEGKREDDIAGTRMYKVSANVYDYNGIGDSNLTESKAYTNFKSGGNEHSYTARYQYD